MKQNHNEKRTSTMEKMCSTLNVPPTEVFIVLSAGQQEGGKWKNRTEEYE